MLTALLFPQQIFEIFFVSTPTFFIKFNKLLLETCPNCLCNFINFFHFSSVVLFSSNVNTCSMSSKFDIISGKIDIE